MKCKSILAGSILLLTILAALPQAFGTYQVLGMGGVLAVSTSEDPGSKTFTIIVGHDGFNHTSGPLTIQVNQGDNVTIKFVYGDSNFAYDNPHVIRIEGYNIQTQLLDKKAPVQRLSFIVGQTGTFVIHCVLPCFGMENLQNGALEVIPSPLKIAITTITTMQHMEYHQNLHFHVIAVVTDKNNKPVSGVLVDLFVETDFGLMKRGSNVSQADGSVHFLYPLTVMRDTEILVSFGGSGNLRPSNVTGMLLTNYTNFSNNQTTPYLFGQTRLIDLRLIGIPPLPAYATVLVAMVVLAAVWSVYVFVLTLVIAIRRLGKKGEANK
jgi:hypothetical protein